VLLKAQTIRSGIPSLINIDLDRQGNAAEHARFLTPRNRRVECLCCLHGFLVTRIDHGIEGRVCGVEPTKMRPGDFRCGQLLALHGRSDLN
jgi:hypothetical protein